MNKRLWILLILVVYGSLLQATTAPSPAFDVDNLMDAPMLLSQDLPVEISYDNDSHFMYSPQAVQENADKISQEIRQRAFPWTLVIASLAWLAVIGLAYLYPPQRKAIQTKPLSPYTPADALQDLSNQETQWSKGKLSEHTFLTAIEQVVRKTLSQHLSINAKTLTIQELLEKTRSQHELNSSLSIFFAQIEPHQFNKKEIKREESQQAYKLAKEIVQSFVR